MPGLTMRRWLPDRERVRRCRWVRAFGPDLTDARLWNFNRRTVAGGCAVGLFWAFMPLPTQLLPAAATAVKLRVNLPLSLAMTWVANPLTLAPMLYLNYRLGAWLLNLPPQSLIIEPSWDGLGRTLTAVGPALVCGAAAAGAAGALAGYGLANGVWRWRTMRAWRRRKLKRLSGHRLPVSPPGPYAPPRPDRASPPPGRYRVRD